MKKSKIFLILGIVFFVLSVVLFLTLKEEVVNPNCVPCGYDKYTDAFVKTPMCFKICRPNSEGLNFITHNSFYAIFVWLGVLSLIISFVYYLKERVKK